MEVSRNSRKINCDDGGGGGEISNCLICYADVDLSLSKNKQKESTSILGKHLNVILILKQIFELPSEQLEEYLVNSPNNVEKWITVCDKCRKLIDKYKDVQRKLFKIKLKLIKKVKDSFNESKKKPKSSIQETEVNCRPSGLLNVTDTSRQFIKERDYNSGHQFITIPTTATDIHFKISTAADDNPLQNEIKINEVEANFDDTENDHDDFFLSADNQLPSPPDYPADRQARAKPELILPKSKNDDQDWIPDSSDSDDNDNAEDIPEDILIEISDIKPSVPSPSRIPAKKACHLCPKSFHDKSTLTRHLINIHKQVIPRKPKKSFGKSTKCPTCLKNFPTPSLLYYHQQYTHLKQFDHHCSICFKGFRSSKDLDYHENVCKSKSSGKSKVSCTYPGCQARYWNEDGLKKHLELHEKGVSWQCYQCGKSFLKEVDLKVHEKMYHGSEGPEVSCEFCGDRFATKISLYGHKKISLKCRLNYQGKGEAECKLTCEICGDKFGTQRALRLHIDTRHNNKWPFNCGEKGCGKGFVQVSKLRYHLKKKHGVGEYRWRCEVEGCGLGYDSKKLLEEHRSTHGGEPGFECGDCGKMFYFRHGLDGHRRKVHASGSGGKGVSCKGCGRGFKSLVYLRCHMKNCRGIKE